MKFGQLIEYNKIFFLKSHAENKAGRLIRDLVLLFKKSFICGKSKWPAASFQYILIGLNMAYNKNCMKLLAIDLRICWSLIFQNRIWELFLHYILWMFQKNFLVLYYLTKFHWLIAFASWDISQHVYYICLFSKLWRQKIWN